MEFQNALGRLLRLPEVLALLKISRSTFYENIHLGFFPPPVRLGKRTVAWWEGQLLQSLLHPQGWAGVLASGKNMADS